SRELADHGPKPAAAARGALSRQPARPPPEPGATLPLALGPPSRPSGRSAAARLARRWWRVTLDGTGASGIGRADCPGRGLGTSRTGPPHGWRQEPVGRSHREV